MSRQIVKQPNGRYAIWSSVVNNFVYTNLTREQYIEIRIAEEAQRIKEEIYRIITDLDNGEKPYQIFTKTYEECLEIIKEVKQLEEDEKGEKKG